MVSLHAFLLAAALTGSNDTVLLHFTADWCGPCRLMQPTVQRLHDAGYPLREVNVDREADLTRQFRVGRSPASCWCETGARWIGSWAKRVTTAWSGCLSRREIRVCRRIARPGPVIRSCAASLPTIIPCPWVVCRKRAR